MMDYYHYYYYYYYYYYYVAPCHFFTLDFQRSLNDCKILFSIPADLNSAVVRIISILLIFHSSSGFSKLLRTVSTNFSWSLCCPYHRHFHVSQLFFNSLARSKHLLTFFLSFISTLWYAERAKFFFLADRSGLLAGNQGYVLISKSQRILCVSYSRTGF